MLVTGTRLPAYDLPKGLVNELNNTQKEIYKHNIKKYEVLKKLSNYIKPTIEKAERDYGSRAMRASCHNRPTFPEGKKTRKE